MDRINNIQVCPTPVFYQGGHRFVRFVQEPAFGVPATASTASVISVEILPVDASAVADTANSAGSIVSALYYVPHLELAPADTAASAGSVVSAANTGTSYQRNAADAAASAGSVVSAFVFTPLTAALADVGTSSGTIVSADVMNSTTYALTSGTGLNTTFAHGLAVAPAFLRAVLLCTTADTASGAAIGDEIPCELLLYDEAQYQPSGIFSFGANGTVIYLTYTGYATYANVHFAWLGAIKMITSFSHFSLKVYWQ